MSIFTIICKLADYKILRNEEIKMSKKTLGILTCLGIAIIATYLGTVQNIVGAPMVGLFIGMILFNVVPSFSGEFKSGASYAGKKFLKYGIILAGATLNFGAVLAASRVAMPILIFNIFLSFGVASMVGRYLELSSNTRILVGGGSCICGGTAIATLASIIKAKEEEIAYAMTAIFLFDIFAALVYPYLAQAINLSVNQFGVLAGAAINDTSSVAAAEATYNALNGIDSTIAITVKLARTTMLIFVAIAATIFTVRNESKQGKAEGEQKSVAQTVLDVFPWFILIFVGMALLNTFGLFDLITNNTPSFINLSTFFKTGYKYLITAALVGVGFKIKFKELFTKGTKHIILGGVTWAAIATSTLIFVHLFADFINAM